MPVCRHGWRFSRHSMETGLTAAALSARLSVALALPMFVESYQFGLIRVRVGGFQA
jgi:hypothetical protein